MVLERGNLLVVIQNMCISGSSKHHQHRPLAKREEMALEKGNVLVARSEDAFSGSSKNRQHRPLARREERASPVDVFARAVHLARKSAASAPCAERSNGLQCCAYLFCMWKSRQHRPCVRREEMVLERGYLLVVIEKMCIFW